MIFENQHLLYSFTNKDALKIQLNLGGFGLKILIHNDESTKYKEIQDTDHVIIIALLP